MEGNEVKKSLFVRVFEVVIRFVLRFRIPVLVFVALVTAFFIRALFSLQIDANIFSFSSIAPPADYVETPSQAPQGDPLSYSIPEGVEEFVPEQYGHVERPEDEKLHADIPDDMRTGDRNRYYGDGFVVVFSSSLLYTPEVLNLISDVMAELESLDIVGTCLSPFDFVTVEKRGTRLALTPMSPVQDGEEWTEETAEIFRQRLLNDDMAKNYLYSKDGNTIMLYYRTTSYNQEQQDLMNAIIDPLRDYGRVAINGGSSITNRVTYYIFKDLGILLALCFLVILLVYYLSYRSLRAVVIPSSLSIIGIIWTLGTMSLMGYRLTIISILTPCLVLTLGSSYSVHMLSEYFTEAKDPARAVNGYAKISKTILSACMTTIVGFITMLVCKTPMFKEFGVSVSIGIAYCAVLAILYLPTTLSLLPQPKEKKVEKIENGRIMGTFLSIVETCVTKYWFVMIALFVVLVFGYFAVKDEVSFNSNYVDYFPQDDWFVEDTRFFAQTMGGTDPYYMEIVAPDREPGFFLQSENIRKVYDFENTVMEACPDIVQSLSFPQYVGFLNKVYSGTGGIPENNGLVNFLYRTLQQMKAYIGADVLNVLINEDASVITLAMRNYDSFEQNLQTTASARRLESLLRGLEHDQGQRHHGGGPEQGLPAVDGPYSGHRLDHPVLRVQRSRIRRSRSGRHHVQLRVHVRDGHFVRPGDHRLLLDNVRSRHRRRPALPSALQVPQGQEQGQVGGGDHQNDAGRDRSADHTHHGVDRGRNDCAHFRILHPDKVLRPLHVGRAHGRDARDSVHPAIGHGRHLQTEGCHL